ncbi:MAG TPA: DsbA family protein [Nitrososphaeraceae archaeon]|jgi:protein-disulfide isomerase
MKNKLAFLNLSLALILLSLASAHVRSPYPLDTIIHVAKAAETAEERANEAVENSNVQNGFSPISPEESKQIVKQPEKEVATNLLPQSLIQSGSTIQGNPTAPITMIEFGDFQCKFCDRFAKETEPLINATYIQTGKANMIFKNFVTHGPDSLTAAMAGQCANDQGKFWNFYSILYKYQGDENSGWASANNVKKFASQISGLNTQKFNSCLDSGKHKSFVENDTALAISSGFQGTPSFVIEKKDGSSRETLLGAYPFPSFQAVIDKKLND